MRSGKTKSGTRPAGRAWSLRWRILAALFAAFLATVLGVAVVGERLAAHLLDEQVQDRLLAARDRAALALQAHVDARRENLAALAADPRTVMAFKRLRRATHELDMDPATEPRSLARARNFVRSHLSRYYANELRSRSVQLDSLIVPDGSAIWLQAVFFSRVDDGPNAAQTRAQTSEQDSLYEAENEIWQPVFERLAERFGWQDALLADVADGRLLYSVSKTPIFQTSLIDGPYAESGLGSLFRELRVAPAGEARFTDFTPFVPAHGFPLVFAGAPIFDGTRRIGVLLVQERAGWIDRVLSEDGDWSATGLGATGDLFVVGSDAHMRSRSRFFERLRSMDPAVERLGTTVLTFGVDSIPEPSETAATPLRYVNHRHVPVYGVARRLEIAELPWTVVAELETAEALAPLRALHESLSLVVLGVLLLGGLVTFAVAAWVLRPVGQILDTLRAVRGGDSTARVPAQPAGEFRVLGIALNELIGAHAQWIEQESAERERREAEAQELGTVLKALARGDLSRRARVDGQLAGLANAVNVMGESMAHLTERLCVVPPRVVETAYAMQTVADQVLQDAEWQRDELESAAMTAGVILDWLRGCTIDAQGVIDAASRVEQMARSVQPSGNGASARSGEVPEGRRSDDESDDGTGAANPLLLTTARYQRLRATIDSGAALEAAVRAAIDAARRIRTGVEGLRGHAQTLQLIALDLHTKGGAASQGDFDLGAEDDLRAPPSHWDGHGKAKS